jgi:U5 small nuclear ribonucleoprotein component
LRRFGNFIGEAEESEDDSQHGVDAGAYVYDDYPEEAPEATGQELMEIDGVLVSFLQSTQS